MTIVEIQLPSDWSHLSFQQVRLHSPLPSGGFWVELVYKKEFQPTSFPGGFRKAGLDLGLNNLAALVSTVYGVKPVIVKGGALSSKLHFYRREQDRLRTQYARQGIKTGSALNRLCAKHDRQMADFLHKLSRFIIDWCVTHQLDELVVGLHWGWKQRSKLRR
ncbi:MAG: transposase, partial [Candidatus Hodarchaeota archaeon]